MIGFILAAALAGSVQHIPAKEWLTCKKPNSCTGEELDLKVGLSVYRVDPIFRGSLEVDGSPSPNASVVEIHIDDPKGQGSGCIWEVTAPISHERVCVVDYEGRKP